MNKRLATVFVALLGCVEGKEAPKPTSLVPVQGGTFVFGSTVPCFDEDIVTATCDDPFGMRKIYPTVLVEVKPFAIEEHEVTNYQYRYCVEMGYCDEPVAHNVPNFADDYYYSDAYKNYPVVNVTQEMARKYCEFLGRRLPTEFEWELVAGGDVTNEESKRLYPYESQTGRITDCRQREITMSYCAGSIGPSEVKTSADDYVLIGDKKVHDLTGNVAEWVEGRYKEYVTCKEEILGDPAEGKCQDCFLCDSMMSEPLQKHCRETCYLPDRCEPCLDNPNCFKQCAEDPDKFPGIPRCISYGSEVVKQEDLIVTQGPRVLAKGGSYSDDAKQTCRARVSDRSRSFDLGGKAKFYNIGFRCVADLP